MMSLFIQLLALPTALLLAGALPARAEDDKKGKTLQVYPAALLPFQERALKKKLGDGKRPSVLVEISEQHTGQVVPLVVRSEVVVAGRGGAMITIDPAAETEVTLCCKESGFTVIDPKEGRKKDADILIQGEAFSEHAMQHGNLISVKGRLEVRAIDQSTGKIVAVDRQTTVVVDLTEQIAAKNALQEAGAIIAERPLPKIVVKGK